MRGRKSTFMKNVLTLYQSDIVLKKRAEKLPTRENNGQ